VGGLNLRIDLYAAKSILQYDHFSRNAAGAFHPGMQIFSEAVNRNRMGSGQDVVYFQTNNMFNPASVMLRPQHAAGMGIPNRRDLWV